MHNKNKIHIETLYVEHTNNDKHEIENNKTKNMKYV